ncbi:HAMP domain-containing histidine kinase [Sulfurimonas lithotrophica]|uniref:histidine kinase n=2 Tax=Sulfurimonas lithotrophica TaxID=2590022 RepID=A0A5P8P4H8_9BACT|nr:HAMP domain-containing histidine kinase [Sulfurimonas lithotrophica]
MLKQDKSIKSSTDSVRLEELSISYECLASIGNSFELESMMSEFIITFARKTNSISALYYKHDNDDKPLIHIGKKISFNIQKSMLNLEKAFTSIQENKQILVLSLKTGYLVFIYENSPIKKISSMLENFKVKLNLSISACEGVHNLEKLNEELEDRVEESVRLIRENEKMLLAQSKQAIMGEMIEMIAHQWRQPITSIGMIVNNLFLDIAIDEIDMDEMVKDLEKISYQVKHLSGTIDDFRDFFKESKEKNSMTIKEVMAATMIIIEKQLSSHNIEIRCINNTDDISINTYKNELIQVVLNILANSKDAYNDKELDEKIIEVESKQVGEDVVLYIRDNAGGIPENIIGRIFEPYFSTKNEKNGTGLGLYMSMIIVKEHIGGKIEVKNTDNGAEFKITIPIK